VEFGLGAGTACGVHPDASAIGYVVETLPNLASFVPEGGTGSLSNGVR